MLKALKIMAATLLFTSQLFMSQLAVALPQDAVNINTASAVELAAVLDGVGNARAEAIVAYREANGEFKTAEDLLAVRGIGDHVLDSNRTKIATRD